MVWADLLAQGTVPQAFSYQLVPAVRRRVRRRRQFSHQRWHRLLRPVPGIHTPLPASGCPTAACGSRAHTGTARFEGLLNLQTKTTSPRTREAPRFATVVWPEGAESSRRQNGSCSSSFAATRSVLKREAAESQHPDIYQNILLHRADSF